MITLSRYASSRKGLEMAKKKDKKSRSTKTRRLSRDQISITGEAEYIIKRAQQYDSRVVGINRLILFSTETGDAWMLDPEDGFAMCLAREGGRQPFRILETPTNFSIEWNADYRIDGEAFTVAERSGRVRTIFGYPTEEILRLSAGASV